MNQISFHPAANRDEQNLNVIQRIYRLRCETFIGRLAWEVDEIDGEERDRFDCTDSVQIAVSKVNGDIEGCWRALPTVGDYMLKSVFPELLQGEDAPEDKEIWEISRFAVRKGSSEDTRGYMNMLTIDLVRSFWDFAQIYNVKQFVTVTTVSCERLLRQLGVNLRRFGEGQAMQIGKEKSVALWIEVDSNLRINTH
jgi:N-acyl-L-homoserine lactone synthetase